MELERNMSLKQKKKRLKLLFTDEIIIYTEDIIKINLTNNKILCKISQNTWAQNQQPLNIYKLPACRQ